MLGSRELVDHRRYAHFSSAQLSYNDRSLRLSEATNCRQHHDTITHRHKRNRTTLVPSNISKTIANQVEPTKAHGISRPHTMETQRPHRTPCTSVVSYTDHDHHMEQRNAHFQACHYHQQLLNQYIRPTLSATNNNNDYVALVGEGGQTDDA